MLAASGIAAPVTQLLGIHAASTTSRCDGGRLTAQQQDLLAPPSRRVKKCQEKQHEQQGSAGVSAAWGTMVATVSGLLRAHVASAEESILGDAAGAYARITGAGSQAPEPAAGPLNIELPEFQVPEVDLSAVGSSVGGATNFVFDNPVVLLGAVAAVAVPLLVSRVFQSKRQPYGAVTAKEAYAKLSDATLPGQQQLVDIRLAEDVNAEGSPDLRSLKKRVYQVSYSVDQEDAAAAVVKKLKAKLKKPEETTLYILDRFEGSSLAVAKLATEEGFKAAYAVKGGAEGPNGWRSSELPWLEPRKAFKLDINSIKEVLDSTLGPDSVVPTAMGVAAAAAAGVVVFSEAETAMQLVGSAALLQLFVKKFLFAKDRKETIKQIQELLDTKVAPQALVDDMKSIGKSLASTAEEVSTQVVGKSTADADSVDGATSSVGGATAFVDGVPASAYGPTSSYFGAAPSVVGAAISPEGSSTRSPELPKNEESETVKAEDATPADKPERTVADAAPEPAGAVGVESSEPAPAEYRPIRVGGAYDRGDRARVGLSTVQ